MPRIEAQVRCFARVLARHRASPDSHPASRHEHVDHVFAAVASSAQAGAPAYTVRWFSRGDVTEEPGIAQDSQLQVLELLARI